MEWRKVSSSTTIFILLFLFKPSIGAPHLLVGDVTDDVDTSQELSLLMDLLDKQYTPQCLRVVLDIQDSYRSLRSSSGIASNLSTTPFSDPYQYMGHYLDFRNQSKPYIRISLTSQSFQEVAYVFKYLSMNTVRVTPFSCVTYMLSEPPDSRILPFFTDASSSQRFKRYFFVRTQNIAEAERFLLDQRLQKEVNVAALLQDESPNKSYWRVLIRQLLHPSGSPQVLTVNRWSRDTGLTSTENIFPEQMANFYGTKLHGVTLSFVPFVDYETVEGSRVINLKPSVDKFLIDVISEQLNFTYEMTTPPDGLFGYLHEDGYYVGVVGEAQFGRANFTLDMSVTLERMQYVDFTDEYFIGAMTFLTAKNRPAPLWLKLVTPFRTNVWLCVLFSVVGGSLLYHIIYHAQATLTSSRLLSSHAFMHVLASFLSQSLYSCQSIHAYLSIQAGRIFLGFWLVYAFLVTSYYKTSLTSTLAVPFAPSTIDTLQELIQSGLSYGIGAAYGSEYTLFSTSKASVYQEMFRHMTFYSPTESMHMVAEGRYAYIYFKTNLQMLAAVHNKNPGRSTDIHVANEEFFTGGYAFIIPKGVPYKRTFDAVIAQCVRAGLVEKWVRDANAIYVNKPQTGKTEEETRKENEEQAKKSSREVVLSLDHLQGPFFLLCFGSGGGVLLLIMELLAGRGYCNKA